MAGGKDDDMEVKRVKLGDVFPDENNPREEFSGIEEMAESFKLNAERPGEPFIPPILVRDGDDAGDGGE